ncbi:MAG: hypothetical protein R2710_22865 [Acidimicrobiales bacterium]
MIVGIVTLSPMQLVAARLVGALVALVIRRQSALKMTFNLAVFTFEAALASFLLHVVGAPLVDRGWFWATAGSPVWFAVVADDRRRLRDQSGRPGPTGGTLARRGPLADDRGAGDVQPVGDQRRRLPPRR